MFLDRDGTLIRHVHHLTNPEEVELLPRASDGIALLRSMGLKVVVCTNQSVIGRGLCDAERVEEVHRRMVELLEGDGVEIDGIVYCPHRPEEGCGCRKPAPGLGVQASRLVGVEPGQAVVIGDQRSDIEFGRSLGSTTIQIDDSGRPDDAAADYTARHLLAAAEWIQNQINFGS